MTKQERADHIKWIEGASYEELLRKQRFASLADPFFLDPQVWLVFKAEMNKKKKNADHTATSKKIGWEG